MAGSATLRDEHSSSFAPTDWRCDGLQTTLPSGPATSTILGETFSVSPRLGVSWKLREGWAAFGQYTHGFRSPPFEDVNFGFDVPLFRTRALPNPDLRPESSDHLEFGLRFAEATLRAQLGRGPAEERPWVATLAAGYAHGEDRTTGLPLNSIDPPRASLSLQYAQPGASWRVEGVLTATLAQDRVDESVGPLARAAGYATLDLIGSWQIAAGVHLRAAVYNVLDRRYREWSDMRGLGPDDPFLDLSTRPGRSVTVGLTLRLD